MWPKFSRSVLRRRAREHMPLRVRRLLDGLVLRFAALGGGDAATVPI